MQGTKPVPKGKNGVMIAFIRRELVNHQVRPPVLSVDVIGQVGRCKTMVKRVKTFQPRFLIRSSQLSLLSCSSHARSADIRYASKSP